MSRNMDVLVIGGGQAGLAMGYHLKRAAYDFQIVERHPRIGDSWRNRYDSLILFTPRAYSALPGLSVPGDPADYPTKVEIADYLEQYATHLKLPVTTGIGVQRLTRVDGGFRAQTDAGESIDVRAVVVATGAFQVPAVPAATRGISTDVAQFTPETYKRPSQVPPGRVLIVGDGATGRQIALELAGSGGHDVMLATGRARRVSPERIASRSIFWWMDHLGLLHASRDSRIGRYLMRSDPFPGKHLGLRRLQRQGVRVVGRVIHAEGNKVSLNSGETTEIAAVLWSTGYRDDSGWVAIPEAVDARGSFLHQRGVSPVPGLYFIGRSWQWTRGSALLAGVGDDAGYLLQRLAEQMGEARQAAVRAGAIPA